MLKFRFVILIHSEFALVSFYLNTSIILNVYGLCMQDADMCEKQNYVQSYCFVCQLFAAQFYSMTRTSNYIVYYVLSTKLSLNFRCFVVRIRIFDLHIRNENLHIWLLFSFSCFILIIHLSLLFLNKYQSNWMHKQCEYCWHNNRKPNSFRIWISFYLFDWNECDVIWISGGYPFHSFAHTHTKWKPIFWA